MHGKRMRKYNRLARDSILESHNPSDRPSNFIDLHGLRVKEAEKSLLKRMNKAKADGEERMIVIVGKGNHSVNGPKIKPAIQKLAQSRNLMCAPSDGNEGKIVILLEDYEPENAADTSDSEVDLGLTKVSKDEESVPASRARSHTKPHVARPPPPQPVRVSPYPSRRPPPVPVQNYASSSAKPRVTQPLLSQPPQASTYQVYPQRTVPQRTVQSYTNSPASLYGTTSPYRPSPPIASPPSRPLTFTPQARSRTYYSNYDVEAGRSARMRDEGGVAQALFIILLICLGIAWIAYEVISIWGI